MDIPLVVLGEEEAVLAHRYYPGVTVEQRDESDITPQSLISQYDILFLSDLWPKDKFFKQFGELEKTLHKELRRVFCPHGFSDKAFYFKMFANEDLCLVYGQHMIDFFAEQHILETLSGIVTIGNYRYLYYKQNQAFYEKLVEEELISHFDKKRPVIVYAPTWTDFENTTTFFNSYEFVMGQLPQDYNLIVKLHPRLELEDPANYYRIIGQYEKQPNILFTKDFLPVYPLLAKADVYLGDMSSVGYDYLIFDKPMLFLNKHAEKPDKSNKRPYLFNCGIEIIPSQFSRIYRFVAQSLEDNQIELSPTRREAYRYTFGAERPFNVIKAEILEACNLPRWPSK